MGGPARLAYHGIDGIRFGALAAAAAGRPDQPHLPGGGVTAGAFPVPSLAALALLAAASPLALSFRA